LLGIDLKRRIVIGDGIVELAEPQIGKAAAI
jgi:hypothetical protein